MHTTGQLSLHPPTWNLPTNIPLGVYSDGVMAWNIKVTIMLHYSESLKEA